MTDSFKTIRTRISQLVRLIKSNKQFVLGLIFLSILGDILYIPQSSDLRFFGFVGLYATSSRWYKLKSKVTFTICLVLLGIMYFFFLTTGTSVKTERTAVWLVLFWILGIIQQWKEIGKQR